MREVLFTITLPGDLANTIGELADHAIDQAREDAPDYVMPAKWIATHLIGEVGDWEVTFLVARYSN